MIFIYSDAAEGEVNGKKYAIIPLRNPRAPCNDNTQVKLPRPPVADYDSVPVLHEAGQSDIVAGGNPVDRVSMDNLQHVNRFSTLFPKTAAREGHRGATAVYVVYEVHISVKGSD